MESEDKTIREWCTIECEKIVEEIAPGFKCSKNAITGEIVAFIHEEDVYKRQSWQGIVIIRCHFLSLWVASQV